MSVCEQLCVSGRRSSDDTMNYNYLRARTDVKEIISLMTPCLFFAERRLLKHWTMRQRFFKSSAPEESGISIPEIPESGMYGVCGE